MDKIKLSPYNPSGNLPKDEVKKMAHTVLSVLQLSVIKFLENETPRSRFPGFHKAMESARYGMMELDAGRIAAFQKELEDIQDGFLYGAGLITETAEVRVSTHAGGYSDLFAVPVLRPARPEVLRLLASFLYQCEIALHLHCGFGRFSAQAEELHGAMIKIRTKPISFLLHRGDGPVEVKMAACSSNNDLATGRLADGIHIPFQACGIIRCEKEDTTFGFRAEMEYASGQWMAQGLECGVLLALAVNDNEPYFRPTYLEIVGKEWHYEDLRPPREEFLKVLKRSPLFQQALNRVCSRWLVV